MKRSRLALISALAVALAFIGCSSDDEKSSPGTGGSAGAGGSSGGGGGGSSGTGGGGTAGSGGSTDKCAADDTNAASTLGCNGAKPGAQADDTLGGKCTPDGADGQGSCASADQNLRFLPGGSGWHLRDRVHAGSDLRVHRWLPNGLPLLRLHHGRLLLPGLRK